MANEWVDIELYGPNDDGGKRRVTIADGDSVSIGTILKLTDPRTGSATAVVGQPIVGIAAEEHVANKGVTTIAVWTDGMFEVTASSALVLGDPVVAELENKVKALSVNDTASNSTVASWARVMGRSYETAAPGEAVNIRLGPL